MQKHMQRKMAINFRRSNGKELELKCVEHDIPYYISRYNFERTDLVKRLEACLI